VSDLRPIVQDDPTERERALLGSARLDSPPAGSREGVLAALGLAAVTTTAGAGAAVTATTGGVAVVVKWLVVGAIGGGITLGAVFAMRPSTRPGASHPVAGVAAAQHADEPGPGAAGALKEPPAPPASPALPEALGDVPSEPLAPAARVPDPAVARSAPAAPVPSASPPAIASGSQARLAAEVAALQRTRQSLASGEPAAALRSLDDYDQRFAQPILGPEAMVLRIEALIAAGRVDIARQIAGGMLAAQPDSPYARRVRSLLAAAPSNAP
jgi:hypothetical protein